MWFLEIARSDAYKGSYESLFIADHCFSERVKASTIDFMTCQARTGGIAFPRARYCRDSGPSRRYESGNDWIRVTSRGMKRR